MNRSEHALALSDTPSAPPFYPGSYLRVLPSATSSSSSSSSPFGLGSRIRSSAIKPSLDSNPNSFSFVGYPSSSKPSACLVVHPVPSSSQQQMHSSRIPSSSTCLQHSRNTDQPVMCSRSDIHTEPLPPITDLDEPSGFSHATEPRRRVSNPILSTPTGPNAPTRPSRTVYMVFGSRAGRPVRRKFSVPVFADGRSSVTVDSVAVPAQPSLAKYSIVPVPAATNPPTTYLLLPQSSPSDELESLYSEDGSCLTASPLPTTPLYNMENGSSRLRSSSSTLSISSTSICSPGPIDEEERDVFDLATAEPDDESYRPIETILDVTVKDRPPMTVWPNKASQIVLRPPVPLRSQRRINKYAYGILF